MVEVLILVGTNPVPCYVSAIYLKNHYNNSRISLICSKENKTLGQTGTEDIGQRIKTQLIKEGKFKEEDFNQIISIDDVTSFNSIECKLNKYINEEDKKAIHLNFTGGTKTMAAFCYYYLKSHYKSFSSSYLDSRRKIMIIDGNVADSQIDLRQDPMLAINLETMAVLQNQTDIKPEEYKEKYPELLEKLIDLLDNGNLEEIYGKRNNDLEHMANQLNITPEKNRLLESVNIKYEELNRNQREDLEDFINGRWLEYYVYNELIKLTGNIQFYFDVHNNQYQVDIVAIYGYQLTLISVTTHKTKPLCKLKAFEAITRATQLGGEEAKTILISRTDEPDNLQRDVEKYIGTLVPNFRAFGETQLKDKSIFPAIINYIKE
ncbi:MAG TPA: hypothetical protein PKM80_03850 [Candidatus Cloacimonas sp.]|nr:hypothetical protein [Candidatus Cloacimonas sp.]